MTPSLERLLPLVTEDNIARYNNEVDKLAFLSDITGLWIDNPLLLQLEELIEKG